MNIGKSFKCDTCGSQIDCRIGMSTREVQPFQFACPVCEEVISFVIGTPQQDLKGAIEIPANGPFGSVDHFVDLHLDFPVSYGKYKRGITAFIRAANELGEDVRHLSHRLSMLNELCLYQRDLERLITQYKRGDIQSFEKVCKDIPGVELKSQKKQDVLAALYSATSIISSPFTNHEQNEEISGKMPFILQKIYENHTEKFEEFSDEIVANNFLKNLHHDCLTLYPKIIALDLPIRPALYFDYTDSRSAGCVPARISTSDFDTCSNFYKDLAEVYSRQLVILAGLNNLIKRGDFNLFADSIRLNVKRKPIKDFSSLDRYADVDLGRKLGAIDDSFYSIDSNGLDNKLRNGIAHYKYEYKQSTQLITYYSGKEGMKREKYYTLSFIGFMRKTLLLFREVHNMNHVMKSLLYFRIFILNKNIEAPND